MAKYCFITFVFWLIGGLVGLHHFYLGRDRQGFLWATTFGGFLIGWLKDFSKLAHYTEEANKGYPIRASRRPSFWSELHRVVGFVLFGHFYRMVFVNGVPNELPGYTYVYFAVAPLGTAFGCYLVSNAGHIVCSWKYPVVGAYIGEILFGKYRLLPIEDSNILLVVLITGVACVIGWKERRSREKKSWKQRLLLWSCLGLLILSLWGSFLYHNAVIEVEGLEKPVKLRKVVSDFLLSPQWKEFREELKEILVLLLTSGDYDKARYIFEENVRDSQLRKAMEVLGFDPNVTGIDDISEEEIKRKHKMLAMKYHPDKQPEESKEEATVIFIEIQESYETLSKYVKRKQFKSYKNT